MNEKHVNITKRQYAIKGCASSYNAEILNSLNLELKLENTEPVIKNRLKPLLTELRGFRFYTSFSAYKNRN